MLVATRPGITYLGLFGLCSKKLFDKAMEPIFIVFILDYIY